MLDANITDQVMALISSRAKFQYLTRRNRTADKTALHFSPVSLARGLNSANHQILGEIRPLFKSRFMKIAIGQMPVMPAKESANTSQGTNQRVPAKRKSNTMRILRRPIEGHVPRQYSIWIGWIFFRNGRRAPDHT